MSLEILTILPAWDTGYLTCRTSYGSTHYNLVNDDDDYSYIYVDPALSDPGIDIFGFSPPKIDGEIYSVALNARAQRNNSQNNPTLALVVHDTDHLEWFGVSGYGYATYAFLYFTNPETGAAWEIADLNSFYAGVRLGTAGPTAASVAKFWANIKYYPGGRRSRSGFSRI